MPVSTTYLIPAMVMEVSAMLVERITLRQPWKEEQTQASQKPCQISCTEEMLLLLASMGQAYISLQHAMTTHHACYASSCKLR